MVSKWLVSKKGLTWLTVGGCVFVCGMILFYGCMLNASSQLAKALVPQYPGSELISSGSGGGSMITSAWYVYHTEDDLDDVLDYMERHMSGFTVGVSEEGGLAYFNQAENTGIFAHFAVQFSNHPEDPVYPTAQVWLFEDERSGVTVIRVLLDYASS